MLMFLACHICWFNKFVVADLPRNLQLSSRPIYHPGDIIQCSAEGNPEPSYVWKDLVSGRVTEGAVLDISEEMADDNYTFQCTASNQYSSVSFVFNFTVELGGSLLTQTLFLIPCTNSVIAKFEYVKNSINDLIFDVVSYCVWSYDIGKLTLKSLYLNRKPEAGEKLE